MEILLDAHCEDSDYVPCAKARVLLDEDAKDFIYQRVDLMAHLHRGGFQSAVGGLYCMEYWYTMPIDFLEDEPEEGS